MGQRVARFSTLSNPFEVTLDNEFFDGFESLDINQPFGNPYIHSYEALVEGTDVDKKPFEGIGAYLATQVYPETGTRFGTPLPAKTEPTPACSCL